MSLREAFKSASLEEKREFSRYLDKYLSDVSEGGEYWSDNTIMDGLDDYVMGKSEVVYGIKAETAVGDFIEHNLKVSVCEDLDSPVLLTFPDEKSLLVEDQELANLGHLFIALAGGSYDKGICQKVLSDRGLKWDDLSVRVEELMRLNDGLPMHWNDYHINEFLLNKGCVSKADAFRLGQMNFAAMLVPRNNVGMKYSTKPI